MIVITGATGQLGRLVIDSLLKKVPAANLVAAVRDVEKARDIAALGIQVRQADYNQPASWNAALQGADKVLLISSSEIGQRTQQHRVVIDAAKRAGVKLLAYTSVLHADTSVLGLAGEHRETEAAIRASGLPFVLLRNGWYTENYAMGIPTALSLGAVYGCAGDGRISSAARADYAEAAAVILTSDDQADKVYELAGDNSYTLSEFAAEISRQSGKAINYVNLTEAEYKKALLGAGLPEPLAELLANSDTGVSRGALFDDGKQLSELIGRSTLALETAVSGAL
ncbi:SDR family oxidoreductase [Pseudomonas sp. NY15435]|uniref:SDR family oxidoreductase n=1 Tax=Pseudomonas sp. NY15435 TaxID=3400358 RepID=UPI003A843BBA